MVPAYHFMIDLVGEQQLSDEGLRDRKTMEVFDGAIRWCRMGGSRDTTRAQSGALGCRIFLHIYVASLCQH
jgi:hypothetical protein